MDNLTLLENNLAEKKTVSILPVPLDIGSDNEGMDNAPKHLLKFGLKDALASCGFVVSLLPEVAARKNKLWGEGQTKNTLKVISNIAGKTAQAVKSEITNGNKVLGLGGDHAISIGTISGAAEALKGDLGVIWIDAHPDLQTHETSLSQAVHGMVSAALMGYGDKSLTDLVPVKVKKDNFLYIGLKDLDQAEIDRIRKEKLAAITMFDIATEGFPLITKHIQALYKRTRNIWISIDVDSIDEEYAPASAMATTGGLTYREITNLVSYIGKTANVVGADIVELTPAKDFDDKTVRLCLELAASAFGGRYNWYSEYMNSHSKR